MADPITQIIEAVIHSIPAHPAYADMHSAGVAAARSLQAGQAEQPAQQTDLIAAIPRRPDSLPVVLNMLRETKGGDECRLPTPACWDLAQYVTSLEAAASLQQPAQQAPQGARMPLTREQIDALVYQCRQAGDDSTYALVARAEAAHGIAHGASSEVT